MNIERLKHLIVVLERVEPKRFDLNDWVDSAGGCGMTACAMGWAGLDPEFQRQGLRLRTAAGTTISRVTARTPNNVVPVFSRREGFAAAREFFEIDMPTAERLFAPSEYSLDELRDPAAVIARIRELIGEL